MTANLLHALQAAAPAAPEPAGRTGWLDPMLLFFLVFVVAQLYLIARLLLSRSDESKGEDS